METKSLPMTIAILAGGESRRMGADKAVLEIEGMTLLERAARTALDAGLPTLVVGRPCPDDWPLPEVDFILDASRNCGPLGGLQTALHHAIGSVLALACDMPRLTADALLWLSGQASAQTCEHGLAILNNGQWEPLFSVYTHASLPLIESRLAAGLLSLHGLVEAGEFGRADAPAWVAPQLVNINTPQEFANLLSR